MSARLALGLLLVLPLALGARSAPAQTASRGKPVYEKWCAGCHGGTGAGDGPGATRMLPRPRDFTKGVYKIRTTASGEIPTDDDLLRVVETGMPGTAMPEWKSRLSEQERRDVVAYIKSFSNFFASQKATALAIGQAPSASADAVADGRRAFEKLECAKCHGADGRGDGKSAPTLKDDWDHPIRAADLTERWKFRGGSSVEAIYTRLRSGIDGTPMPSLADVLEQKIATDAQLWHLAAYVQSLSPEAPLVREVVRARLVTRLPQAPNDSAWNGAERFWIPTVGQVVRKPRQFAPTVDGVWVQAMHDGRRLALKLTWHDPSRSPDPAWDQWLGRVAQTMTDGDTAVAAAQQADRLVLQWAPPTGDESERPYFLGGSAQRPVHVWRWSSAPDQVEVGAEKGLGTFAAAAANDPSAAVSHAARHANGEWQLQLVRALRAGDTTRVPAFAPGHAVPLALRVADGSDGEDDARGAVSTWYAVHLDVPTPVRVYAAPAATVIVTAGLGLLLVVRAQRREGNAPETGPLELEDIR
jgi:mono/diheme cytochrome c family protein